MINPIDPNLAQEVAAFGAKDMELCMQCGTCSASCPLSRGSETFPRKIYRFLQLGLRGPLLGSAVPWLCYYCGDCNLDCPRGAEPAETMMAARRWLTTQYDWTGLARKLYLSPAWELGALGLVASVVVLLFLLGHGPVVLDRVSVNSFAPVVWIEIGDLVMAAILSAFLLSNAVRMFGFIMGRTRVPLRLYATQAAAFVLHFLTQMRWRECGADRSRWLKHLTLVTGYLTMMTLVIVFIRWFQVDDSTWHFTSIFGYYATGVLLYITVEMFRSRLRKQEAVHRFSELSDWLFLILLFLTTLTGILMHVVRMAGWPMGTYVMYVVHLAVAVPMLVIEVPFGKWSHLFYRPLAVFLTTVKQKATRESRISLPEIHARIGDAFLTCMQCGTCTAACPWNQVSANNPRRMLRQIALETGTASSVDHAVWNCLTCSACGTQCPRGIDLVDLVRAIRETHVASGRAAEHVTAPLNSLAQKRNPWNGDPAERPAWVQGRQLPALAPEHEYCLFTCCTIAYGTDGTVDRGSPWQSLPRLMTLAGVSFGTLGLDESCCGDPAHQMGSPRAAAELIQKNTRRFLQAGIRKLAVFSPHCLSMFRDNYPGLTPSVTCEHYSELLARLIAQGRLKPARELDRVVTFHDPCYLGRASHVYQAPRRILQSIPGLKLIEMANHKEHSLCCGGGGGGAWRDGPDGESLGQLRIRQAMVTGAREIVTACPFCLRMLDAAAAELGAGHRIVVRELADVLMESVEKTHSRPGLAPAVPVGHREEVHV